MKGRNYAAILLLVIGILEVYSHPQTFNAQDAEELARSLQTVGGDELNDYDDSYYEKYDDSYPSGKHVGRKDRITKRIAKLRRELIHSNVSPEVPRNPDPAQRERIELVRQFNSDVDLVIRQRRLSRNKAIDLVLRENNVLLTDEAYFYDLSDRESYSSADKHADREDGRSKRSPGASKKTPEKLQELRQELNRTNAAPVVARRTNSQRREDRDVVTRRYNAAVADLMQREHMTRAAAVQYLLQHNMQLVNDYLIAQGM